jgi:hypothetical protein
VAQLRLNHQRQHHQETTSDTVTAE